MDEAIILAGGLGTRLHSVLNDLPKPMADVNGRPFLAYLLDYLDTQNVSRVILSVGYRNEAISGFFKNAYKGLRLEYVVEPEPLGTGGALLNALSMVTTDNVFVLNGDTYFPIALDAFIEFHKKQKGLLTIALKAVEDVSRYGCIICDSYGYITGILEKGLGGYGEINAGIYAVNVPQIKQLDMPVKFSLEKDLLETMCHKRLFSGKLYDTYFVDIGIPEDYYSFVAKIAASPGL